MSEAPAILVDGLEVCYRARYESRPTLKASLVGRRRTRDHRVITALAGVSLEVARGDVLGVIGSNGAGKSTLLRAIAGILPPSRGRIEVRGEVSTLLALGVGFRKNLTGRENVMLASLASGRSARGVHEAFEAVVEFSGLGEFIDMPVRTYSSGMQGRLAFSVAAFMSPDILLIDEALAAGDAEFRVKSSAKMRELCASAGAIVLVSHGLSTIRELATHCLWLDHGKVMALGDPQQVISEYKTFVAALSSADASGSG